MMRGWVRLGLMGLGGLVVLLVAGLAVLVAVFDPNTQKARIVEAVGRATGRELVLAGPLRLTWGLVPALAAEDAALGNMRGGSRPEMATVGRVEARLALLPLLSGRVEIVSVTLDRPDILLETDAQGVGNWQFQQAAAGPGPGPAGPSRPHTAVAIRRLEVVNGRVTWRDGASGRVTMVDLPHAELTLDGGGDHLVADGQSAGQSLHLDAVAVPSGDGAWPVKLSLAAAGATLALDGAAARPWSAAAFRGRVDLAVPDVAALSGLLKQPLPPVHDVRLGMVVGADGAPEAVSLHVGAADLAGALPGATLDALDLTVPALGAAGRLQAAGQVGGGAWRVASGLVVSRAAVALKGMTLVAPGGDLAGDVAVSPGAHWAVRGTLVGQRVDAGWLAGLAPGAPPAAPATSGAPSVAAGPGKRVFGDAPLPWERLRGFDADLQVGLGTLLVRGVEYHGVSAHGVLRDGLLRVDPAAVQAPEGRLSGSLMVDAAQAEPVVAVTLRSLAVGVGPVLQALGLPGESTGALEVDAALNSAGQTPHALAAHLEGHVGVAMVDGSIGNAALAAALGAVVPGAAGRLDVAGSSAVRCLALRLDAAAGQVGVTALQLDTARLALQGGGTVDLADETVALRLRPALRLGGAALLAPVRLEGSLVHPVAALDSLGVEGRPGIVIGGAVADDCPAALSLARGGHAGREPAVVVQKAAKPADLLRSLLR